MNNIKTIGSLVLSILLCVAMLVFVYRKNIQLQNDNKRIAGNFKTQMDSVTRTYKNNIAIYQKQTQTFTKEEFKQLFADEFNQLSKTLNLKAVSQVATVNTETTQRFLVHTKDSTINDTVPVKIWEYHSPTLQFKGLELNNHRQIEFTHLLDLTVTISKQPRQGIRKLFIWQKRPEIVSVIPSDTNTVITNVNLKHIK